jgi:RND family efflux transporter MFP subunit
LQIAKLAGRAPEPLIWGAVGVVCIVALVALSLRRPTNRYVPPPPPSVTVARPVVQKITPYLDVAGTTVAVNAVDLVARVPGTLKEISYKDGSLVHAGDNLFTIEPQPYQVKLQQAQAAEAAAAALSKNAATDYGRQSQLGRSNVVAQATVDTSLSKRDSLAANLDEARANTQLAAINYTYTRIAAPFDGIVTAHLKSVGELVGVAPTVLATIVQPSPINVTFNVNEADLQRIRADLFRHGLTMADLGKIPLAVGLPGESGYSYQGVVDYVAPMVSAATGTLEMRGVLANADRSLLPGSAVRVRVAEDEPMEQLLLPESALCADQAGQYLLVVTPDDVVDVRRVVAGGTIGAMAVIESGVQRDDRVVVGGLLGAVPGEKIDPRPSPPA